MCRNLLGPFKRELGRFAGDREAATATEYAVMLALMLVEMVWAISQLGQKLNGMYATVVGSNW